LAARGLTSRQVRELLDEHGSYDAAIEARPELADELRAAQGTGKQLAEQFRPVVEAYSSLHKDLAPMARAFARPPKVRSFPDLAEAKFERDVRVQVTALERYEAKQAGKGEPGAPKKMMSRKTFLKILELSLKRARSGTGQPALEAISKVTRHPDLDFVSRKRVTPIADWVAANQKRAERALSRGEIPALFRPSVTD
jgi:hypothetical protein